jgi:anti-anti-sigma factor
MPEHAASEPGLVSRRHPDQVGEHVRVLRLEGELDAFVAPELRAQLRELIDGDRRLRVLVVDLERVTFLDSSILGALVGGRRLMRERGGELRLVYPSRPARRIFELTGLDAVFPSAEQPS